MTNLLFFKFILSSSFIPQATLIMLSPFPKLVITWNGECLVDDWSWSNDNDNDSPRDSCRDPKGVFWFKLRSAIDEEVCVGRTGTGWMSISDVLFIWLPWPWVIFSIEFSGCRCKKTGATVIGKGTPGIPPILEVSQGGREVGGKIAWAALSRWLVPSLFGIAVT